MLCAVQMLLSLVNNDNNDFVVYFLQGLTSTACPLLCKDQLSQASANLSFLCIFCLRYFNTSLMHVFLDILPINKIRMEILYKNGYFNDQIIVKILV